MDDAGYAIRGTCHLKCPEKEINERITKELTHYFERPLESVNSLRPSAENPLMVKEYRRPAPGRVMLEPCELRPADILMKTVNYLFHNIIPRKDVPWHHVYEFVFDRLRAVRQDMVIQRISGNEAIWILESCVRFLIYAGYRLCMEPMDNFDPEINRTHTLECLKRLMILYSQDDVCHCRRGNLALRVISSAVGNRAQQLPVSQLASWFNCTTDDVKVLCTSCGFTVTKDVVSILRSKFTQPQHVQLETHELELLETSPETLSDWLCGKTCRAECPARTEQK